MDRQSFPAARLSILDAEVVIVFVDGAPDDKGKLYSRLSVATGEPIVLLWQDGFGRSRFIAPPEQHPFFEAVGYDQWCAQINSEIELVESAAPPQPLPE